MTVAEMIAELRKHPPNEEVWVIGEGDSLCEPTWISRVSTSGYGPKFRRNLVVEPVLPDEKPLVIM